MNRPSVRDLLVAAGAVALATAASLVATAAPALAAASTGAGYVWANNATAEAYTPSAEYNYNSTDAFDAINTITLANDTLGPLYTVRFPGLGLLGGTVQVTAYGPGSVACQVQSWGPSGNDQLVRVRCFNNAGIAVTSRFTAAYTNITDSEDGEIGYVWANNATSTIGSAYIPSTTYQGNSAGDTNTITRVGTGSYSVYLPGIGAAAGIHGNVQVTPYGSTPARCVTPGWGYNVTGQAENVAVSCYSLDGQPANTRFTVTFVWDTSILGLDNCCDPAGHDSAYALVYVPNVNGPFDIWAPTEFSTNVFATATGNRLGVGSYSVTWQPFLYQDYGNVQVTAYSGQATNCKVEYWNNSSGINVNCFDTNGTAVDSAFSVAFTGPLRLIVP